VETLRVRLLGEVQVEGCEPAALGRRQSRTLLKILALHHGHPVAVDTLAECLWADEPPAHAADQISVPISRLRGLVGAGRGRRSDAGYTLTLDWLDVDALGHSSGVSPRPFMLLMGWRDLVLVAARAAPEGEPPRSRYLYRSCDTVGWGRFDRRR
jgi:hypothetical protein